jgi:hypothetical protein
MQLCAAVCTWGDAQLVCNVSARVKLSRKATVIEYMERETLLSTLWKMDEPDAEIVRQRLESGDLIPAGNFRNEPASYWKEDDDNG